MVIGLPSSIVFGPVPSRRLGMSLGVNNVYEKYCSYSCVYCSAGHTTRLIIERMKFYDPQEIVVEVVDALKVKKADVVTFVPNGEPTLDINLGKTATLLKREIDVPLAIISNSSLIDREDVRTDLMLFDIVSLKIDTVNPHTWRRLNRPHPSLDLKKILEGIKALARDYSGRLIFETMLVEGYNDNAEEAKGVAEYLAGVEFHRAYLITPIRPPAEAYVKPPSEDALVRVYQVFAEILGSGRVELIAYPEKPFFGFTGDLVEEIARTILVHPIPVDYVYRIASQRGVDADKVIEELVEGGYARIVDYLDKKFLIPRIRR